MLYAIAGTGVGPAAELTKGLADLRAKAEQDSVDFWLLLEARDPKTEADEAILKWIAKHDVWFEVVTSTDLSYDGAQASEHTEDPYGRMLERVLERRAEDEDGAVLVLLPPEDEDEDEGLMALIENAIDSEVDVLQLNGAMAKLRLSEPVEDPEAEPEEAAPAVAPTKKAAKKTATKAATPTKKAAAKKAAAVATDNGVGEEVEDAGTDDFVVVYTDAELAKMGVPELTGIARGQGIDTKGLGKRDLIAAISGATKTDSIVETETPAPTLAAPTLAASTNGHAIDDDEVLVIVVPKSKLAALLA